MEEPSLITPSARLMRLIAIIFVSNAVLVGWAAMWHHAGAQDASQSEADASASLPLVTLPPPEQTLSTSGRIPSNFVLDEIEKLAQDPANGLAIKPLEYPSLDVPRDVVDDNKTSSAGGRAWNEAALERTQLRLATISQLASAATSLADEAGILTREGKLQEAQMLTEQIESLKKSISRLADPSQ